MNKELICFADIGVHDAYELMRDQATKDFFEDNPELTTPHEPKYAPNMFHRFCHAYIKALNQELGTNIVFIQTQKDVLNVVGPTIEISFTADCVAKVHNLIDNSDINITDNYAAIVEENRKKYCGGFFPFYSSTTQMLKSPRNMGMMLDALINTYIDAPMRCAILENSNVADFSTTNTIIIE